MKKIMILATIALVFSATSAFAASTITSTYEDGNLSFNSSNGVNLNVHSTIVSYVALAIHKSGSREFMTNHRASKIYWTDDVTITIDATTQEVASSSWSGTPTAGATADADGTPAPADYTAL